MKKLKIAILTSKSSWFLPHAKELCGKIRKNHACVFLTDHEKIVKKNDIVFILSYFKIIPVKFLSKSKHNLVVHESDLPKGKGWAPLFWQILEGKKQIPIVLFEANEKTDDGEIYLKSEIKLNGDELYDEIRDLQAKKTIEMCLEFIEIFKKGKIVGQKQKGKSTSYPKRTENDSELNINQSIKDQFNLLRICDNKNFPAFFRIKNKKYILEIKKIN